MPPTRRRRHALGAALLLGAGTLLAATGGPAAAAPAPAPASTTTSDPAPRTAPAPVTTPAQVVASPAPARRATTAHVRVVQGGAESVSLPLTPAPDPGRADARSTAPDGDDSSGVIAPDGAWCWFGDPRAVRQTIPVEGGSVDRTYFGWLTRLGDVEVAQYDHVTKRMDTVTVATRLVEDDHDSPSIVVRPDGRLMVLWSGHIGPDMLFRVSEKPGSVLTWGPTMRLPVQLAASAGYTYPNPVFVPSEGNRLYLFWRAGPLPAVSWSDDFGGTWAPARQLAANGTERPYVKVALAPDGGIGIAFTDAHPREVDVNDVHYAELRAGTLFRSDGSVVGTLDGGPYPVHAFETVYAQEQDPSTPDDDRKAWVHDLAYGPDGRPVIVFATFPPDTTPTTDHRYGYAALGADHQWHVLDLTSAGPAFETSGKESYYSGGIALDHEDPTTVYLSRRADPTGTWEIERWAVSGGVAQKTADLTTGSSAPNVRPVSPRGSTGGALDVIWMSGDYVHYTSYSTGLRGLSDPTDLRSSTSLTTSGPGRVTGGAVLPFTARLSRQADGSPLAGQTLTLWSRVVGSELLRPGPTATTDSTGTALWPVKPLLNTDYEVRWAGDAFTAPSTSARAPVTVLPSPAQLRISGPAGPVSVGSPLTIAVRLVRRVDGAFAAGQTVLFSATLGGTTVPIGERVTDRLGYASVPATARIGESYDAESVGNRTWVAAGSPVLTPVVVRAATTVRVSLAPPAVVRGSTMTVSARLVRTAGGAVLPGRELRLLVLDAGSTTWRPQPVRTTSPTGLVSWSIRPGRDATYRVSWAGDALLASATGSAIGRVH